MKTWFYIGLMCLFTCNAWSMSVDANASARLERVHDTNLGTFFLADKLWCEAAIR